MNEQFLQQVRWYLYLLQGQLAAEAKSFGVDLEKVELVLTAGGTEYAIEHRFKEEA